MKKNLIIFVAGIAAACIANTAIHTGIRVLGKDEPGSRASQEKIDAIEDIISKNYLYDIDGEKLAEGMYDGLIQGLEDDYADYYTEEEYKAITESNEGHYKGIGVVLLQDKETGRITVGHCYENGPAEKAGVQDGDVIHKIEGESVEGIELSEVADKIKKSEGETVTITFYREKEDTYVDISIEKEDVEIPVVSSEMREDQVGYISIYQFSGVTAEQFQAAYEELQEQGMERLIIDLRDNPGGLLSGVVDTLNVFMPEGLLVYTEDKSGKREEYNSEGKSPIDIPLVLLVNENSASASEIFAGAVKDYSVGTIVGTTTYGKGIVQQTFGLGDGSYVKLTVSSYYTPKGVNIHGTGIEPDIVVEQPEDEEQDLQLEKALETARES